VRVFGCCQIGFLSLGVEGGTVQGGVGGLGALIWEFISLVPWSPGRGAPGVVVLGLWGVGWG